MQYPLVVLLIAMISCAQGNCWEDHPDKENHRDTDRMLKENPTPSRDKFSIDVDKGCNPDSRAEAERGTCGPPDRDS